MNRTRILLADGHAVFTDALVSVLTQHFDVIGVARDGRALIQEIVTERSEVVVTDVDLPVLSGIEVVRAVQKEVPRSKFLFLSAHEEIAVVKEAFQAGALGYVLKACSVTEVIRAIQSIARCSRRYVTPLITSDIIPILVRDPGRPRSRGILSQRQREVLKMIVDGMTMKEIGVRLGISRRTAETHKYEMMRVLGAPSTAGLVRYALRANIVQEKVESWEQRDRSEASDRTYDGGVLST